MFRRVLAAAQPMLADMGMQDQANKYAMWAMGAYDEAKSAVVGTHDRGADHYARIAAAVG